MKIKIMYIKTPNSVKWKSAGIIREQDPSLPNFLDNLKQVFRWFKVKAEPIKETFNQ